MEAGTVRVTFDRDVRAARPGQDLFDPGIPSYGVLEPGRMIMEIKFTRLPARAGAPDLPPAGPAPDLGLQVLPVCRPHPPNLNSIV